MAFPWAEIIGGAASIANSLFNRSASIENTTAANALTWKMNERNIAFQQAENEITRSREDNAITRQIEDLRRNGLSATLVSPSGASASSQPAPQQGQALSPVDKRIQFAEVINSLRRNVLENENVEAQTDYYRELRDKVASETAGQNLSNSVYLANHETNQRLANAHAALYDAQSAVALAEKELTELKGYKYKERVDGEIARIVSQTWTDGVSRQMILKKIDTELKKQDLYDSRVKYYYQQVANMEIQERILSHNLKYARKLELPVGVAYNPKTTYGKVGYDVLHGGNDFAYMLDFDPNQFDFPVFGNGSKRW